MINYLIYYLFVGTIVGFFIETIIRMSGSTVDSRQRFWLITIWPLMLLIFMYYFFKHMFFNIKDDDEI